MILVSFAFISKCHRALMAHEPTPAHSTSEAREVAFQNDTVVRWMERMGNSHKPPPVRAQVVMATPAPSLADPHAIHLELHRTSSQTSDASTMSGVQAPPPAYTRHWTRALQ